MLEIFILVIGGLAVFVGLFTTFRFEPSGGEWQGGRRLTLGEVASRYEGDLKGLTRVSVVVPRLEDPAEDPSLKTAVKANFSKNIGYLFLIAPERYESAVKGYFPVFRQYAREALEGGEETLDPDEIEGQVNALVKIVPLKSKFSEFSYIFYHCKVGMDRYALAFRGTEKNQGISKWYVTVEREIAGAVFKGIRAMISPAGEADASSMMKDVDEDEFASAPAKPARNSDPLRVVR